MNLYVAESVQSVRKTNSVLNICGMKRTMKASAHTEKERASDEDR